MFLDLGLSTDEIGPILDCTASTADMIPESTLAKCAPEAITLYEGKLRNTQKQINTLKETEAKLEKILSFWRKVEKQTK